MPSFIAFHSSFVFQVSEKSTPFYSFWPAFARGNRIYGEVFSKMGKKGPPAGAEGPLEPRGNRGGHTMRKNLTRNSAEIT